MKNKTVNAIVSVFKYSRDAEFQFSPVSMIVAKNDSEMDVSVFASIEVSFAEEKRFTLILIYATKVEEKEEVKVQSVLLKEFPINVNNGELVEQEVRGIDCLIPLLHRHRTDIKFNFKNIPVFGKGVHTIILSDLTEAEIMERPEAVMEHCISCYPFKVE